MNYAFFKSILADAYVNTVERMRIALLDFENNPPVLIYQMGKDDGSSTVYKSSKLISETSVAYLFRDILFRPYHKHP
jgi:hypothetical protein